MFDVKLERVHRIDHFNPNNTYIRPIIVQFAHFPDREYVWQNRKCMKGTRIFIDEDFSKEIQSIRRKLRPVMMEASRNGYNCELIKDRLIIDDKTLDINMLNDLPK